MNVWQIICAALIAMVGIYGVQLRNEGAVIRQSIIAELKHESHTDSNYCVKCEKWTPNEIGEKNAAHCMSACKRKHMLEHDPHMFARIADEELQKKFSYCGYNRSCGDILDSINGFKIFSIFLLLFFFFVAFGVVLRSIVFIPMNPSGASQIPIALSAKKTA
jgi:hypothetical protein